MTTAVIVHTVRDRNRLRAWAEQHRLTPVVVGETLDRRRFHGAIVMMNFDRFPPSPIVSEEEHLRISGLWIAEFMDRCMRHDAPIEALMGYDALRRRFEPPGEAG